MIHKKRLHLKIIILGDSGVGKTSLLRQYINKQFIYQYKATIGADFLMKEIKIDNQIVQLQIWDTAGQEKYHSLGSSFYRNSDCCVLVFDKTDPKSFESIENWRNEFLTQLNSVDPDTFPFVLLGNKSDKECEIKISEQKVKAYCNQKKIPYFETSAKENINIDMAFEEVSRLVFKRDLNDEVIKPNTQVILDQTKLNKHESNCCNNKN